MAGSQIDTVKKLLDRHGQSYADEIGINIGKGNAEALFQLLVASILFSTRIRAEAAVEAAKALFAEGWNSADKMCKSSWERRVKVLNENGYARYDESTSSMLRDTLDTLMAEYGGDLSKLREKAGKDQEQERKLLKAFKGIGDVGVDIFFREAQTAWDELYPFIDGKAAAAAKRLGLPDDGRRLADFVAKKDFPILVAALIRTHLADDYDNVKAA